MSNDWTRHYTTDPYGYIATPNLSAGFLAGYADRMPYIVGEGRVKAIARKIADSIAYDARTLEGPVVWITGNQYMPPLRSIPDAEYVWNAANNDDGELWSWFYYMVEEHLEAANVALEQPDYDNALYAVDLNRWQHIDEETIQGETRHNPDFDEWDINSEWERIES